MTAYGTVEYARVRPWAQKWTEVTALLAEIEVIYRQGARGNEDVRLVVENFFGVCRELADWIKQTTGKDAIAYVHAHPVLRICDGLAQTKKHHTRDNVASITARISSIGGTPQGERVMVAWSRGGAPERKVDALDLACRCVAAWRGYFGQEGLNPPA